MPILTQLFEKISLLVQQENWQELVAIDDEVRSIVAQAIAQRRPEDHEQLASDLAKVHNAYKQAIDRMQANQGQSAKELSSVQRSLKAAKSYLDSSKF